MARAGADADAAPRAGDARDAAPRRATPRMFGRAMRARAAMLVVALVARGALPTYDASNDAPRRARGDAGRARGGGWTRALATRACAASRATTSWDGEHFVALALDGYAFEHQHAFYPGLPIATRAVVTTVKRAVGATGADDARDACATRAAATTLNTIAFAASVEALYAPSRELPKDDALAEAAATLYAMNPANVFYGSAYTEAGFAYAQFVAGTLLQENKMLASGVAFGVATMFRSNGVLCVVPLLAHAGREVFLLLRNAEDATRHRRAARHVKRAMLAVALAIAPHYAFALFGDMR